VRSVDVRIGWGRVSFLLSFTIIIISGIVLYRMLRDKAAKVADRIYQCDATGSGGASEEASREGPERRQRRNMDRRILRQADRSVQSLTAEFSIMTRGCVRRWSRWLSGGLISRNAVNTTDGTKPCASAPRGRRSVRNFERMFAWP
jgi:hypothetical protein